MGLWGGGASMAAAAVMMRAPPPGGVAPGEAASSRRGEGEGEGEEDSVGALLERRAFAVASARVESGSALWEVCRILGCVDAAKAAGARGTGEEGASPYEVLGGGVGRTSAGDKLKARFRALALAVHPDKFRSAVDGVPAGLHVEAFEAVNAAWGVLGDAGRRAEYDGRHAAGGRLQQQQQQQQQQQRRRAPAWARAPAVTRLTKQCPGCGAWKVYEAAAGGLPRVVCRAGCGTAFELSSFTDRVKRDKADIEARREAHERAAEVRRQCLGIGERMLEEAEGALREFMGSVGGKGGTDYAKVSREVIGRVGRARRHFAKAGMVGAREREERCSLAEDLLHRSLEDRLGQAHNWAWDAFEENSTEGDARARMHAMSSRRILKALSEVARLAQKEEEEEEAELLRRGERPPSPSGSDSGGDASSSSASSSAKRPGASGAGAGVPDQILARRRKREEASQRVGVHLVGLADLEEAIAMRREEMSRKAGAGVMQASSKAASREAAALLSLRSAHLALVSSMRTSGNPVTLNTELQRARIALVMAFEELDTIHVEMGSSF